MVFVVSFISPRQMPRS